MATKSKLRDIVVLKRTIVLCPLLSLPLPPVLHKEDYLQLLEASHDTEIKSKSAPKQVQQIDQDIVFVI